MTITVNGAPRQLSDGTTLADLLESLVRSTRGSAAAVDGEVVPRGSWRTWTLRDGQAVELLTAVQGG